MKRLWTPWRMTYLRGETQAGERCLFCRLLAADEDETNLVLHRGNQIAVMLNRYPYSNGHMLLIPYPHAASLEDLPTPTLTELMTATQVALCILRKAYSPDGFNVGINIGEAAGAGIPDHVHIHVLPRWSGDTNFMTTISGTRVVPEELPATYTRLKEILSGCLDR